MGNSPLQVQNFLNLFRLRNVMNCKDVGLCRAFDIVKCSKGKIISRHNFIPRHIEGCDENNNDKLRLRI